MSNLITLTDPHSPAAEAYQSLRTNIDFAGLDKSLNTLLVTAADDSADKSVALANLAVVGRRGTASSWWMAICAGHARHEIFGVNNQAGLSTWIGEDADPPLQACGVDNLFSAVRPAARQPCGIAQQQATGCQAGRVEQPGRFRCL